MVFTLYHRNGLAMTKKTNKHTIQELLQWQALPLSIKIRMTMERIRNWVNEYGEDGVYVSFSDGKDSTVLLDIVRNMLGYKNIPAVFVDVPTQYPELKEFATSFENVTVLKPNISFMQVCEKYGFPLISKEVSEKTMYARKYLQKYLKQNITATDGLPHAYAIADILGIERRNNKEIVQQIKNGIIPDKLLDELAKPEGDAPIRIKCLCGTVPHKEKGVLTGETSKMWDYSKYKFFLKAPFEISNVCCSVMKKTPIHKYSKETGRYGITAQMASESRLRTTQWLKNGCNGFDMKNPVSNPMSFWTDQDVLLYIKTYNLPICSVYGDVVVDSDKEGQLEGQLRIDDVIDCSLQDMKEKPLKTTGCSRTGCMLCGFGCHLEKSPNRFEQLKKTHPGMYKLLDVVKNNGVTFREAIEWTNKNGNMDIKL